MSTSSVRLINYKTRMIHLRVLLLFSCFVGISEQGEINVAHRDNGGACRSSIGSRDSRYANCNFLIDGHLDATPYDTWAVSGNIESKSMIFEFNTSNVILKRIQIIHVTNVNFRNIKSFQIEASGLVFQFGLNNTNPGDEQKDVFTFTTHIQTNETKLTVLDLYNDNGKSAIQEVEVYALPFTPTPPTTLSSPTTTYTPDTSKESPSPTTDLSTLLTTRSTTTISVTTGTQTTPKSTTIVTSVTSSVSTASTITGSTSSATLTKSTKSRQTSSESTITSIFSTITDFSILSTKGMTSSLIAEEDVQQENERNDLGLILGLVMAFLVIVAVVLAVIFFVMRRKKQQKFNDHERDKNGYANFSMVEIERASEAAQDIKKQITVDDPSTEEKLSDSSLETSPDSSVQDLKLVVGEPESANTQPLHVYSNAIKLDDLASTVDDMLQNPVRFQDEFKSIPAGKQHPTTFADRSTLHVKNRFRNIKPYDHSRVSLIQKESDDSMYINANFISAYNQPKYYIAAQGPNKDSVDDFWRMIWEHRVPVIVMVTNCKEAGKDKCTKYWPDQGDDKQTYDDVDVVFDKNSIMADYKIRDFKISKRGEIRAVRQYHYTSWPDEGVPTSCSALISFVNRIREYTDDKDPPNVVHCSAGVGRTGTFIAVNYSMDMAREESIVDIKKVVHRLREDRINMVQTFSQYKFLYALMLECLHCGEVTIPCQGASEKIQHLFIQADGKYSQAEKQSKVLDVLKPKNWEDECLAGRHKDNIKKNRTQTILPHDNHRPYLRRRPDYTSNYINAVFVDGYKKKNKFLLTQHPLENTVVDLWRTVLDFNISTIVMLNSCSDDAEVYWPEDEYSEALPYGDFLEVTFKRVDKQDEFTITEVQMFEDKEKANVVTHIQVKKWSEDSKPKLSILPALYNIVTQAQMADEDSRIMIHNLNGDGNTGVYCALHQIFDKIKEEQEIDIFNAVKNTRMSRPDAIPDMDTYRYLHDASVQFIEQFSTYANFQ